jgi:hypothetical protein
MVSSGIARALGISPPLLSPSSRAYMIAHRVVFKLWMGATEMDSLEVLAPAEGYQPGLDEDTDWTVLAGTGFHLTADVYNNVVDTENPVVSGTSSPFDVIAGDNTEVTVRPIPNAPTTIASPSTPVGDSLLSCYDTGTVETMIMDYGPDGIPGTADDVTEDMAIYHWGEELWFQFSPTGYAATRVTVSPDASSGVYFQVADSTGEVVTDGYNGIAAEYGGPAVFLYGEPASVALLSPDSTYYIGLLSLSDTVGSQITSSVSLTYEQAYDDAYEENDTLATAYVINKAEILDGVDLDPVDWDPHPPEGGDWYKFTMDGSGPTNATIRIVFDHDVSDLDLQLWDWDGAATYTHMAESASSTSSYLDTGIADTLEQEEINIDPLVHSHTYYIWVGSDSSSIGGQYQLQWQSGTGTITIDLE